MRPAVVHGRTEEAAPEAGDLHRAPPVSTRGPGRSAHQPPGSHSELAPAHRGWSGPAWRGPGGLHTGPLSSLPLGAPSTPVHPGAAPASLLAGGPQATAQCAPEADARLAGKLVPSEAASGPSVSATSPRPVSSSRSPCFFTQCPRPLVFSSNKSCRKNWKKSKVTGRPAPQAPGSSGRALCA